MGFIQQLDVGVFNILVAGHQTPAIISWFGIICAKFLIYFIPLHLLVFWFLGKRIERQTAVAIVLSVFVGLICSHMIGMVFYRPRPFVAGLAEALIAHKDNASFPSNHALIFTCYGVTLFLYRYKTMAKVALILAVLTCWGRIFTGVHYPLDIIGGVILGVIVSTIIKRFIMPLIPAFLVEFPPLRDERNINQKLH